MAMARMLALVAVLLAACTAAPADSSGRPSPSASPRTLGDPTTATASPTPSPAPSPTVSTAPSPSVSPAETAAPTQGDFDAGRALEIATQLAAAGPRPAGSAAERAARFHVSMALWAAGWEVREQVFSLPQGGESANVIATIGEPEAGPHVVVGAHLDTVAGSPGANDNGSGIGILVALAEELADEAPDLPVPVVLVAFGAEESQPSSPRQHHVGSEVHAGNPLADVVAMVSIDMVGNGDTLCICWFSAGPDTLAQRLREVGEDAGIAALELRAAPDWSDHGPFARRGIPAAFLWTGDAPGYHGPGDTADLLDPEDLARAGRLALAFVRSLDPADRDGLG